MPIPTQKALRRKPRAVVNLGWSKETITKSHTAKPEDYEYEWFETAEGQDEFFHYCVEFNDQDLRDHGDIYSLCAEVLDTKVDPMVVGKVHVTPQTKYMEAWAERVKKDPTLLVYVPPETDGDEPEQKVAKGRKPSAAAQAAKGDDKKAQKSTAKKSETKSETKDAPKKQVRKPSAAAKQAISKGSGEDKEAKAQKKAATVKQRVANKKSA